MGRIQREKPCAALCTGLPHVVRIVRIAIDANHAPVLYRGDDATTVQAQSAHGAHLIRPLFLQPFRYLLQEEVAVVMAQGVVYFLEAVQIHDQNRQWLQIPFGMQDQLVDAFQQKGSVGQAGEVVMEGVVPFQGGDPVDVVNGGSAQANNDNHKDAAAKQDEGDDKIAEGDPGAEKEVAEGGVAEDEKMDENEQGIPAGAVFLVETRIRWTGLGR
jgi:hypothetical protein